MHLRIIDHAGPIGRHEGVGDGIRARFVQRLDGDFAQADFDAEARFQQRAVVLQMVKNAAAHRAAADHADIDLLHSVRASRARD